MTIDEVLQLQLFDEFRQQIETLQISTQPIIPEIDDNVRYGLKVYRQKIYGDIDKQEGAMNGNKKLSEIQNFVKQSHHSGPKKRVSSQQKNSHKDLSKYKNRQYSVGQNENKNRFKAQTN